MTEPATYCLNLIKNIFALMFDLPASDGQLFRTVEMSATSWHKEGRITAERRAQSVADFVHGNKMSKWLVWCNTNYESEELLKHPDAEKLKDQILRSTKNMR